MRITCVHIVLADLVIIAVLAAAFLGGNLSPQDMRSTIGGGNCRVCPGEANNGCLENTCTFVSRSCGGTSGGSYKVCTQGTHPEQNCLDDDTVSCGTRDYCCAGEGGCTPSSADCSCHSDQVTYTGCL